MEISSGEKQEIAKSKWPRRFGCGAGALSVALTAGLAGYGVQRASNEPEYYIRRIDISEALKKSELSSADKKQLAKKLHEIPSSEGATIKSVYVLRSKYAKLSYAYELYKSVTGKELIEKDLKQKVSDLLEAQDKNGGYKYRFPAQVKDKPVKEIVERMIGLKHSPVHERLEFEAQEVLLRALIDIYREGLSKFEACTELDLNKRLDFEDPLLTDDLLILKSTFSEIESERLSSREFVRLGSQISTLMNSYLKLVSSGTGQDEQELKTNKSLVNLYNKTFFASQDSQHKKEDIEKIILLLEIGLCVAERHNFNVQSRNMDEEQRIRKQMNKLSGG